MSTDEIEKKIREYIKNHYGTDEAVDAWFNKRNYLFFAGDTLRQVIQSGRASELLKFVKMVFN